MIGIYRLLRLYLTSLVIPLLKPPLILLLQMVRIFITPPFIHEFPLSNRPFIMDFQWISLCRVWFPEGTMTDPWLILLQMLRKKKPTNVPSASSSTLALAAGHLNPRVLVEVTESPGRDGGGGKRGWGVALRSYPLVNIQKTTENHHFQWINSL